MSHWVGIFEKAASGIFDFNFDFFPPQITEAVVEIIIH